MIQMVRVINGEWLKAVCDHCGSENMSHVDHERDGIYLSATYSCDDCDELTEGTLVSGCDYDKCLEDAVGFVEGTGRLFCDTHREKVIAGIEEDSL